MKSVYKIISNMCGIFAIFIKNKTKTVSRGIINRHHPNGNRYSSSATEEINTKNDSNFEDLRELGYRHSGRQRHRGPDSTGVTIIKNKNMAESDHGVMVHERLAVLCVQSGKQPFGSDDGDIIMAANGEIYNYLKLASDISKRNETTYKPRSDCDVILQLYQEYGLNLFDHINGMFAFVLYDKTNSKILIARDPIGIIPLYMGTDNDGNLWVASEMKCLVGKCKTVKSFEPGTYSYGEINNMSTVKYYQPNWTREIPSNKVSLSELREKLEYAVRTHLQCDKQVPFGALLSGGVDSSLIASMATKIRREDNPKFKLKTYSVGLPGAPDFKYSRMVADFIDSDHTEVVFTVEQGLDCIRDIIYHIESYDVTTIRSSIPMFILSRYIKSEGLKMVLSGEGADEIFGGYLYFHQCPNYEDFHHETISRVNCLHLSDCLRANKSTMAWGVEMRVPFLDTEFINYAMNISPEDRAPGKLNKLGEIEKYILREAFNDNYIPHEVLWRQKEQFSDGVGYDWIDTIRSYAGSHVTNDEMLNAGNIFKFNTPATKEAYYYRKLFEQMFPGDEYAKTVMKWVLRTDWGCSADPSGRSQKVHVAYK